MRIAEINMVAHGSTGKIMLNIAKCAREENIDVRTFSARPAGKRYVRNLPKIEGHSYYGNFLGNNCHMIISRVFGTYGFHSAFSTRNLVRELKKYDPQIVHLHNLHSAFLNLEILFRYFNENDIQVVWTLHDCWSFTGKCAHFDTVGCDKWISGCSDCPILSAYPSSKIDSSPKMWKRKKEIFSNASNMILVTPSEWLASKVKKSFLGNCETVVINNGIDLSIFKPMQSEFRKNYNCEGKFIILGVAFNWNDRKGLDVFIDLANMLDDNFKIVLVGTNDLIDEKLPKNILSIHSTQNQNELAEIYSAADLFVNPTREDTFPTVNMEALACGTPVLTFETGGSAEIIDSTCGCAVEKNDIKGLLREINRIKQEEPYSDDACVARAKKFNKNDKFKEYVQLYIYSSKI